MERKPFISQRHRGGAHYQPRRAFAGAVAGGRDARTPRTEGSAGRGRPAPRRPPACSQPASQPLPRSGPTSRPFGRLAGVTRERSRRLTSRGNGRPRFPSLGTPPPQRPDAPSGTPSPSRRPRAAAPPPAGWAPPPPPGRPGRLRPRSGPTRPRQRQAPPRRAWPHARTTSQPLALCFQTPARPPRPELQPPGCPSASRPSEHARAS